MSSGTAGTKLLTAEEFLEFVNLPENENKWLELVRGEVIELPSPTIRHGFVCASFARILGNYTYERRTGYVISNNVSLVLECHPDTVRSPDVAFYRDGTRFVDIFSRYGEKLSILAIEVLSTEYRAGEVMRKVNEYLNYGVELVWVVDPETLSIIAYRSDKAPCVYSKDDELNGDELLPGFHYRVGDFFRTPGDKRGSTTVK